MTIETSSYYFVSNFCNNETNDKYVVYKENNFDPKDPPLSTQNSCLAFLLKGYKKLSSKENSTILSIYDRLVNQFRYFNLEKTFTFSTQTYPLQTVSVSCDSLGNLCFGLIRLNSSLPEHSNFILFNSNSNIQIFYQNKILNIDPGAHIRTNPSYSFGLGGNRLCVMQQQGALSFHIGCLDTVIATARDLFQNTYQCLPEISNGIEKESLSSKTIKRVIRNKNHLTDELPSSSFRYQELSVNQKREVLAKIYQALNFDNSTTNQLNSSFIKHLYYHTGEQITIEAIHRVTSKKDSEEMIRIEKGKFGSPKSALFLNKANRKIDIHWNPSLILFLRKHGSVEIPTSMDSVQCASAEPFIEFITYWAPYIAYHIRGQEDTYVATGLEDLCKHFVMLSQKNPSSSFEIWSAFHPPDATFHITVSSASEKVDVSFAHKCMRGQRQDKFSRNLKMAFFPKNPEYVVFSSEDSPRYGLKFDKEASSPLLFYSKDSSDEEQINPFKDFLNAHQELTLKTIEKKEQDGFMSHLLTLFSLLKDPYYAIYIDRDREHPKLTNRAGREYSAAELALFFEYDQPSNPFFCFNGSFRTFAKKYYPEAFNEKLKKEIYLQVEKAFPSLEGAFSE